MLAANTFGGLMQVRAIMDFVPVEQVTANEQRKARRDGLTAAVSFLKALQSLMTIRADNQGMRDVRSKTAKTVREHLESLAASLLSEAAVMPLKTLNPLGILSECL